MHSRSSWRVILMIQLMYNKINDKSCHWRIVVCSRGNSIFDRRYINENCDENAIRDIFYHYSYTSESINGILTKYTSVFASKLIINSTSGYCTRLSSIVSSLLHPPFIYYHDGTRCDTSQSARKYIPRFCLINPLATSPHRFIIRG